MMWKIDGANQNTGADQTIWVEAPSEDGAFSLASACNLMVSKVSLQQQAAASSEPVVVHLRGSQLKQLKPGVFRIAWGVFFGLLFWSTIPFILMIIFGSVVLSALAAAGAAAGG